MKTRVFFVLAAMALLAGCAKEIQAPVEKQTVVSGPITLQVGINNPKDDLEVEPAQAPTRTVLGAKVGDAYPVYWSDGDQIQINDKTSDALSGVAASTSSTSFDFGEAPTAPYNVLYPASIYTDANHVTLPAVQTYKAGGFADGMFPMAGYSADGSNITINHLCAIVKVSVKRSADSGADTDDIAAVRFKGCASEKVSGNFEIDYSTPALAAATGTGAELEVRVVKSLATSTSDAVVYYLVVPAREYANGFDIIVTDANNDIMTKTKSGTVTLAAGKMYSMTEFAFEPSGTDTGIEIASADDLIAFATAFNNGDYIALGGLFRATVTADIAFDATSSDAFNITGGIGTNDDGNGGTNYFNGVFDGNNHTISGLEATVPVFAYTGGAGTVKNLTLSSTCSYTVGTSSGQNHGALVGRNKGTVKDCTSNANVIINNIQDMNTAAQYYGGLVGYNPGGTIDGCTVTGDITCSQTGQTITDGTAYIGGIAGYQYSDDGCTINNCTFEGNITVSDGNTYGGITANGRNFYLGGILAYGNKAAITGCTAGIDGTPKAIDARGAFVPAIGGIVGWIVNAASSEVSGCYNYMSLTFASNGARANTTPCRIGGIAARSAASISSSQNFGAIASTCNSTSLYLAGIVAEGAGIDQCVNNATGTITRTNADQTTDQANRYMYIGGIMGANLAACDVTDCTNDAAVLSNAIGTATQTTIDISGIVASAGTTDAPKQIDIVSCENNGAITLTNNGAVLTTRLTVAGILGYCAAANTTIKSCDNKAQILCDSQQNKAGRVSYSGGIAGLMGTLASGVDGLEIDNCTNSARVWNRSYNNTVTPASSTPFGGGIVGAIVGTVGSKANVHDCSTSGGDVVELRGYCGGIAGYTQDATINDNTVAQAMTGSNKNSQGAGGLVGWAVSTAISGCSTSASINQVKNIGGLVAKLDTGSSIEDCNVNGATLTTGTSSATAAAVLVSDAADGVTITGCGIKGTLNGAAITLSSNMITTDGGATVSGTYLLP